MSDAYIRAGGDMKKSIYDADDNGVIDNVLTIDLPSGVYKVTNLFVDPVTKKLVVEYEDVPVP